MRMRYLLMLMLSLPTLGFGQISGNPQTLFPDFALPGDQWISTGTAGAQVYIPATGYYRFAISASTANLPHDFVDVRVNGTTVSTLAAGNNYSAGGTNFQLTGLKPFEVRINMKGPFSSCALGAIVIDMYRYTAGQQPLISQYTVYTSTYAPPTIKFKSTALYADHLGFWTHRNVVASQSITISPGVDLKPISTQTGPVDRVFKIGACVNKTGGAFPEYYGQVEPVEREGDFAKPMLHLLGNPAHDALQLELANSPSNADYALYSMDGKQVASGVLVPGINRVATADLHSGLYILQCVQGVHRIQKKVVVQH